MDLFSGSALFLCVFFFKQQPAYVIRISDWSSDVCSSALMKLHDRTTPVTDIDAFERDTLAEIGMPKEIVMRHRLPQFGHLFSSDAYSAGYYSRSEEHTSELQSLMRISYAVFCLKKKTKHNSNPVHKPEQ